jgi:hypothetical protein
VSTIDLEINPFDELSTCIPYETTGKGRQCTIAVKKEGEYVPIVRTTTAFNNRASVFQPLHYEISNKIKEQFPTMPIEFNNVMCEKYTPEYRTMKFHSDQTTDLVSESFICLYSCYDKIPTTPRKLVVMNKETKTTCEIMLTHNSCVLFSTATNASHFHKIVQSGTTDSVWCGLTFRLSKTFIEFIDDKPFFVSTKIPLRLATDDETREFYITRSKENNSVSFEWPCLDYTLSPMDLIPV